MVTIDELEPRDWRDFRDIRVRALGDAGTPVAMGGGWVPSEQHDRMVVWGMWTAPEARGHGHGRSLITWLLDWASQRKITTVELHVTEGNDAALPVTTSYTTLLDSTQSNGPRRLSAGRQREHGSASATALLDVRAGAP